MKLLSSRVINYWNLLAILSLSSCMAFHAVPASDNLAYPPQESQRIQAFVLNAEEFRKEYKILQYSDKYELIEDSLAARVTIELKAMEIQPYGCITPQITVSLGTLGFFPVKYEEWYLFEYNEIRGEIVKNYQQGIQIEKVVSWFHLFSLKKNRKKVIGKSMR